MTSLTHRRVSPQIGAFTRSGASAEPLKLLPSGDGWALVGPDGKIVFDALGTDARRLCLEFARARGLLALLS